MLFVERTLNLIKKENITKNKLLIDLNLSKNSFVDWEKRGSIPSADTVVKFAEYFGVSTDYLLGVTDRPNHAEPPAPEMTEQDKEFCSDYLNLSEQGKEYMRQTMFMVKETYKKDSTEINKHSASTLAEQFDFNDEKAVRIAAYGEGTSTTE